MHTGHGTDQPGRWLRREDWVAAWTNAARQK
jgi:hypothetical protein